MIATAFDAALAQVFSHASPPPRLGLAVSGGGDSVALLHLAARWAPPQTALHVVTVDHGLRSGSAQEASAVAQQAAALNLPHDTLRWTGWDGMGNLQSAARDARRELIANWAGTNGIAHIVTGHTRDDQAETLLLRLARGSGVDGLAGMDPITRGNPIILRPLLGQSRAGLRDWLTRNAIRWIDDPSNEDQRFDRVRARGMQRHLSDLGLTPGRLSQLADHMRNARDVLRADTCALARAVVTQDDGDLCIDRAGFGAALPELRTRLLAAGLMWIAGTPYRPRFDALTRFMTARTGTLFGVLKVSDNNHLRLMREPAAVKDLRAPTDALWDGRWCLAGPTDPSLQIAALGETGLRDCPDWRSAQRPRDSLRASPAVWRDDALIAAPLAGFNPDWSATLAPGRDDFATFLLSH